MSAFDEDDDIPSPFGRRKKAGAMYRMGTKAGNVVIPEVESPMATTESSFAATSTSTTADASAQPTVAPATTVPAAAIQPAAEQEAKPTTAMDTLHDSIQSQPHSRTESSCALPPTSGAADQADDGTSKPKGAYEYKYRAPRGLSAILGTMPTDHSAPQSGSDPSASNSTHSAEPSEAVLRQLQAGRASLKSSMVCRPSDLLESGGASITSVATATGTSSGSPVRTLYPVVAPPVVGSGAAAASKTNGVRIPSLDFAKVKTEEQEKAETLKKQQAAAATNKRKFVIKSNKKVEGASTSTGASSSAEGLAEPCFTVVGRDGKTLTLKQIAEIVAMGYSDTEYSDDDMVVGKSTVPVAHHSPALTSSTAITASNKATTKPDTAVKPTATTTSNTTTSNSNSSGAIVGNWSSNGAAPKHAATHTTSSTTHTSSSTTALPVVHAEASKKTTTTTAAGPSPATTAPNKVEVSKVSAPQVQPKPAPQPAAIATPKKVTPKGPTPSAVVSSTGNTPSKPTTKTVASPSPDNKRPAIATTKAAAKPPTIATSATKKVPSSSTATTSATTASKVSMLDMHRKAAAAIAARGTAQPPTVSPREGAAVANKSEPAAPSQAAAAPVKRVIAARTGTSTSVGTKPKTTAPSQAAATAAVANSSAAVNTSADNTSSTTTKAAATPAADKPKAVSSIAPVKVSPFRARSPYSMSLTPLHVTTTSTSTVSKLSAAKKVAPTVTSAPLRTAVKPASTVATLPAAIPATTATTGATAEAAETAKSNTREPWPSNTRARPSSPFSYLQTTASSRIAAAESAKVRAEVAGKSPDRKRSLSASRLDSASTASSGAAAPHHGPPAPIIGFRTKGPSTQATPSVGSMPAPNGVRPPFTAATTAATRLSTSSTATHKPATTSPQRRVASATRSSGVSPFRARAEGTDSDAPISRAFSRGQSFSNQSQVHGPERLAAAVLAHAKKEKVLSSPPTSDNNRRDSAAEADQVKRVVSFNKNGSSEQTAAAAAPSTGGSSAGGRAAADSSAASQRTATTSTTKGSSSVAAARKLFNLQRPTTYAVGSK